MKLPSKKADEIYFWHRVKAEIGLYAEAGRTNRKYVRDIINEPDFPIHHKRAWMMLYKWARRGYYDYGVTVDLGWVTPEGMLVE